MTMTANEKRQSVAKVYSGIIGRNYYSQELRDYCFKAYKDGKYYSDCSSSICYAYREAGQGFGILNTAGIYQSSKLTTVDITIKDGVPANIKDLRVGDMLEFAGTDASRPLKIGHVEMVYRIDGDKVTLCGHGSGRPSYKDMAAYCKSRYNTWASGGWRKGLVCVRRYIQDDPHKSGWQQTQDGWWYRYEDGSYPANKWELINHHYYLFNRDGYMVTGWHRWNGVECDPDDGSGDWYFLDNTSGGPLEGAGWHSRENGAMEIWYVE